MLIGEWWREGERRCHAIILFIIIYIENNETNIINHTLYYLRKLRHKVVTSDLIIITNLGILFNMI